MVNMGINIDLGKWGSVFAVPTSVVDEDLKLASAQQIKVLLYVLRHSSEIITEKSIASALDIDHDDVSDHIAYWKNNGVLSMQTTTAENITEAKTPPAENVKPKKNVTETAEKSPRRLTRPTKPDSIFVAQRLNNDSELAALVNEVQEMMGKPLSSGDTATLVMLHDTDGLPCNVLLMLISYCKSIGKDNMRYIEKMAVSWADAEITTVERAEKLLEELEFAGKAWNTAARIFGISNSGSPTKTQKENAYRWLNEWNFNEDMLREAYERCVNQKGVFNISYTNGILKSWYKNNITTLQELADFEAKNQSVPTVKPKSDTSSGKGASYDIDEYEDFSIFDN